MSKKIESINIEYWNNSEEVELPALEFTNCTVPYSESSPSSLVKRAMNAVSKVVFAGMFVIGIGIAGCINTPVQPIPECFDAEYISDNMACEHGCKFDSSYYTLYIEIEGNVDGYGSGSEWINCWKSKVEEYAEYIGIGEGLFIDTGTDSRPCLAFKVRKADIERLVQDVFICAKDTEGVSRVYISKATGIVDGDLEFEDVDYWESE